MKHMRNKTSGSKRRIGAWTLLTLGVLIAGVWMWSRWYSVAGPVSVAGGELSWRTGQNAGGTSVSTWEFTKNQRAGPRWWYGYGGDSYVSQGGHYDFLPFGLYARTDRPQWDAGVWSTHRLLFWPVPLMFGVTAALLLLPEAVAAWRGRRMRGNKCRACGYDLAGLPPTVDAKCPECGKAARAT